MLQQPLSAASKLRDMGLKVPGTVLICQAGHPDEIIRLEVVPEVLNDFKKKGHDYILINLDRGPDQEHWRAALSEMNRMARRDKPMPNPIPVAQDSNKEWSLSPEDVPLIENNHGSPVTKQVKAAAIFKCKVCDMSWDSNRALATHERFAHK